MPISRSISVFNALNVRDMRPTQRPSVRNAPGRRSGPRTSSAITPTTTSSGKLISNIRVLFARVSVTRCAFYLAFDHAFARCRCVLFFLDGGSESFDRAAEICAERLQPFGAEQQHHDAEDDE